MSKLGVSYSVPADTLRRLGHIQLDIFSCPAWPDLIESARETNPLYVHFPLRVGAGIRDAINSETGHVADWRFIEGLLTGTATPFINVHLVPNTDDHSDIRRDSMVSSDIERVTEALVDDVDAIVRRFGAERFIVENDHDDGQRLLQAFLPEVISSVVNSTGCGLLLDVGHARLAALELGLDPYAYCEALPGQQIREIHVAGIQVFDERWVSALRTAGIDEDVIDTFAGKPMDHLPMTDNDWTFYAWAIEQVAQERWAAPWVVTLEYGGVGPLYEAVTESHVIEQDVNRLRNLLTAI